MILDPEAVQRLMTAWQKRAPERQRMMYRVLDAERHGERDADYLENWVLGWMMPDVLEEHI